MSLVVFPFKEEDLGVVTTNLATAAGHDRVHEVWAVAAAEGTTSTDVRREAIDIAAATGTPVSVFAQQRLGSFRSGKGDGMNTALRRAAERGFDRLHFYDADILNFDESWIDGAEQAADRGHRVVRHRFPRAATDAMITWMVTRPGLAIHFPDTLLPRLGQPLGGELLISGDVVESLAADPFATERSDWGIDTVITYATAVLAESVYENYIPDGKRHALYGALTDIRDMILECLDAVASLRDRPRPESTLVSDPPADIPADLRETVGYDVDSSRAAIAGAPDEKETAVLESLGFDTARPVDMDGAHWQEVFPKLLDRFRLDESAWRNAAFRLWVERVIHYTTHQVPRGYEAAMEYLEGTISDFEEGTGRPR